MLMFDDALPVLTFSRDHRLPLPVLGFFRRGFCVIRKIFFASASTCAATYTYLLRVINICSRMVKIAMPLLRPSARHLLRAASQRDFSFVRVRTIGTVGSSGPRFCLSCFAGRFISSFSQSP